METFLNHRGHRGHRKKTSLSANNDFYWRIASREFTNETHKPLSHVSRTSAYLLIIANYNSIGNFDLVNLAACNTVVEGVKIPPMPKRSTYLTKERIVDVICLRPRRRVKN